MNHTEHQAKDLRSKEGTIGYSRSIVADDSPGAPSLKAQRMVVERELQEHMAKEYPDYKSLGKQTLSDEKYFEAKSTANPRLMDGEIPTEYETKRNILGKASFSAKPAGNKIPIGLKAGGAAVMLQSELEKAEGSAKDGKSPTDEENTTHVYRGAEGQDS